ncbi:hypothetical protein [Wansuia hejianensis]|uniref:Uncharacterized protein n=1 Tax=Wansuia hejianensis TaxID=2763667 RepID=A0A926IGJ8_9FIRM|nr:hypothetical protein [Wansuia hejianensis]MBC8589662.1 hypothetical protein [Wansuia hejianensis]
MASRTLYKYDRKEFRLDFCLCANSPTLNEERIKGILEEVISGNGRYDEGIVRNNVEKIFVFY